MELAPLTALTTATAFDDEEEEDWWDNDERQNSSVIIQAQSKWKKERESSLDNGSFVSSLYYSRPWWIGLTIAVLVVLTQVLVLSMTDQESSSPSPSPPSSSAQQQQQKNIQDAAVAERQFPVTGIRSGDTYRVTRNGQGQVHHYLDDQALILNVHLTHHGGTTFCRLIGRPVGKLFVCLFVCFVWCACMGQIVISLTTPADINTILNHHSRHTPRENSHKAPPRLRAWV